MNRLLLILVLVLTGCASNPMVVKNPLLPPRVMQASIVATNINCYTYIAHGKTLTYCQQPLPPMKFKVEWDNTNTIYSVTIEGSNDLKRWVAVAVLNRCNSGQQFVFDRSNAVAFYRAKSP